MPKHVPVHRRPPTPSSRAPAAVQEWWRLTPRSRQFHPADPPRPRIHPQDDGAGLGNSIVVALYRQNFNDDLSVTAYEAAHEWRDYWRLPPEVRDRLYPDHKEESLIRAHQGLGMTDQERYHEAIRGSQAFDTSLPVHLTSPSMTHNALLSDQMAWEYELQSQSPLDYLRVRREARMDDDEAFEPVRARPRMS